MSDCRRIDIRRQLQPQASVNGRGNPFRGRICDHTQPYPFANAVGPEVHLTVEMKSWDHERVYWCDTVGMIAKEGLAA